MPINAWFLFAKHKLGIVVLGFTLFLGMIGILSYDIDISSTTFSVGKTSDFLIQIFRGQPVFILFLLIYVIVSHRYYFVYLQKNIG